MNTARAGAHWLPAGKRAALCWSIDDIHPARSSDGYEAGGDCSAGALGRVEELLDRYPRLSVTLFVTPAWRPISVVPTRRRLARVPWLGRHLPLARALSPEAMRLDRHPEFVRYLNGLPRTELAIHGLHHFHPGPRLTVEFQNQSRRRCLAMLRRAAAIFDEAGLRRSNGFAPPSWNLPPQLIEAVEDFGFSYVCSARDLETPIAPGARTAGAGLRGVPLVEPSILPGTSAVHLPVNFQATSSTERALAVIEAGGLLSIKSHITKHLIGHSMLDGLDRKLVDALDSLFSLLERRYGGSLWWTSMEAISERVRSAGEEWVSA